MTPTEVLAPWIEKVVREVLELDHLHRDPDGDIPVPLDRTVMYVRLGDGPNGTPRVRVFGPLLKDVDGSPQLYEHLNQVNLDASYLRFYLLDGVVWAAMDLVAESFRHEDLANALGAADFYAAHLGGLLGIPDAKPWREASPEDASDDAPAGPATNEVSKVERDLADSPGPVAHVTVPSNVLPNDTSPADGAALNLRMGYL